jgi:hypothetical protein
MEQTPQGCHRRSVLAGLALGMSSVDFAVASVARASIRSERGDQIAEQVSRCRKSREAGASVMPRCSIGSEPPRDRNRVIAPDMPGFGNTVAPPRCGFDCGFDNLAKVIGLRRRDLASSAMRSRSLTMASR